jgi:hypothetical protein
MKPNKEKKLINDWENFTALYQSTFKDNSRLAVDEYDFI